MTAVGLAGAWISLLLPLNNYQQAVSVSLALALILAAVIAVRQILVVQTPPVLKQLQSLDQQQWINRVGGLSITRYELIGKTRSDIIREARRHRVRCLPYYH